MAKFKGSPCLTDCGGHSAGYKYANSGGSLPSRYSPSFNNGMKIAQGTFETPKAKKKRLAANVKRRAKKQNLIKKANKPASPIMAGLVAGLIVSAVTKEAKTEVTKL